MSRCKSWSSFPIKNNQGTKIKQFSCGFWVEVYLCCQHCSCCVWISLLRVLWKRWEITQPVTWEVYKSMGDRTAMWILHFWVMHFDVRSCVELYLLLEVMEMDHVLTGKFSTSSSNMLAHRVSTCSNRVLVGALPMAIFITPLKPGDWRIYCLIWNDGLDAIQAAHFRRNNDSMTHFSTEDRLHWTRVDLSALCSLDLLHFRAYETWKNWWRKMLDDSLMLKCTCLSRMSTAHTQLLFLVFILTLWRLCKAIQVLGGTLPNCWERMTQLRTFYCFVAAWHYWKWWDLWNWLAETAALLFLSCCYVIISMLFHGCSCFPGNKWNKSCRAEIHPSNIHWTTLQRHIKL